MRPLIVGIQPAGLDATWPRVLPLLQDACARTGNVTDPDDFLSACRDGRMQLWVAVGDDIEAVFVTKIVKHPLRTAAEVRVATGRDYREWYDEFLAVFEAWARANGADRLRLIARPGWQRVVKHLGYEPTHVMLEKDLE